MYVLYTILCMNQINNNRSIATKVDSTYLGYWPTVHSVYVLWQEVDANP